MSTYECDVCCYSTQQKNNFNKHLKTAKHLTKSPKEENKEKRIYECCNCHKHYASRQSLWVHNKKCSVSSKTVPLLKQNNESFEKLLNHFTNLTKTVDQSETV